MPCYVLLFDGAVMITYAVTPGEVESQAIALRCHGWRLRSSSRMFPSFRSPYPKLGLKLYFGQCARVVPRHSANATSYCFYFTFRASRSSPSLDRLPCDQAKSNRRNSPHPMDTHVIYTRESPRNLRMAGFWFNSDSLVRTTNRIDSHSSPVLRPALQIGSRLSHSELALVHSQRTDVQPDQGEKQWTRPRAT